MKGAAWEGNWRLSAGWRYSSGTGHYSYDIACPMGTRLLAIGDGVIVDCNDGVKDNVPGQIPPSGAPSNWIILKFKSPAGPYKGQWLHAYYQHLTRGGVLVKKGEKVKRGQLIGRSGNSGRSSGPHLHLTVLKPGYTMARWTRYTYLSNPGMVVWPIKSAWEYPPIYVYASKLEPGVKNSRSVKELRRSLIRRGFMTGGGFTAKKPGNDYSKRVVNAVKKWQKKKGHRETGDLGKAQAKEFFAPRERVKVV